jgi:hypothetical protein
MLTVSFLERTRLRAARALSERISGREIVKTKSPIPVRDASEDSGPGWFEEFASGDFPTEFLEECGLGKDKLITLVRNVWELECLVRALDSMETLSSLAGLSREYVSRIPSCYFLHDWLTRWTTEKAARRERCGNIPAKRSAQPRHACSQS